MFRILLYSKRTQGHDSRFQLGTKVLDIVMKLNSAELSTSWHTEVDNSGISA